MNKLVKKNEISLKQMFLSKAGYKFYKNDAYWQLDKNNKAAVEAVWELLDGDVGAGFVDTLAFYAINFSGSYTSNICRRFLSLLQTTGSSRLSETVLINYRSSLTFDTEWHLGTIKSFLNKWYELGFTGISEETIQLLNSWKLKGCAKGDVVKRLDPYKGPLSNIELQGFNEGVIQAYEKNKLSITSLATSLVISNTGRRPIQISHLKIKDVLVGKNKKGEQCYLLNIPRAKQRQSSFRGSFKQFAITHELWVILNAQVATSKKKVRKLLDFELHDLDYLELPLFPDFIALVNVKSLSDLRELLQSDRLHIRREEVTDTIKLSAQIAKVYSERTGKTLNVTSYRFRYTTGTRAAREGYGSMVIAELLDHSDNQNSGIYVENIPDHAAKLDLAVGYQLAPYAQAFAGVLVKNEKNAHRGNDINSRVKNNGEGLGTCGNHGFCGANVPIPCYTCIHFQPWLDGPHKVIYKQLVAERERLIEAMGDIQIAAVNDRCILAVAHVIQICAEHKAKLKND